MKKEDFKKGEVIIYQSKGGPKIEVKLDENSVWLNTHLIANLFDVNRPAIVKHVNNIYKTKELEKNSTCSILEQVAGDGKIRKMNLYNLDMIISVGYRVNSKRATEFRIWATKTLKEHLVKGYTLNKKQIENNYNQFLKSIESVKSLLQNSKKIRTKDALELIKMFAETWVSLDAYDKLNLPKSGITKREVKITADEIVEAIISLKKILIEKKEATEIFAQERSEGSLIGIVGNIFQSFGGREVYSSIEEKSAHLLYFIVKNHPFVDGNKRSGAFAFILFLSKTNILHKEKISPEALTALTLLVAESNPKDKEKIIGLILQLLK